MWWIGQRLPSSISFSALKSAHRGQYQPSYVPLVHVPVLANPREHLLHHRHVLRVGRADEEVVARLDQRRERLEALGVAVRQLLGLDPERVRGVGDRLAVLVGAGQEEHLLAALAVVARDHVGGDRRVRVPEVGRRVDVVDRGRYVVGGRRGHVTLRLLAGLVDGDGYTHARNKIGSCITMVLRWGKGQMYVYKKTSGLTIVILALKVIYTTPPSHTSPAHLDHATIIPITWHYLVQSAMFSSGVPSSPSPSRNRADLPNHRPPDRDGSRPGGGGPGRHRPRTGSGVRLPRAASGGAEDAHRDRTHPERGVVERNREHHGAGRAHPAAGGRADAAGQSRRAGNRRLPGGA